MTVVCNNPANSHMKNPTLDVGILNVPNSHPNVVLYNDMQAERAYQQMELDIYEGRKQYSRMDDKKTPTSVWVILGLGGAFGLYKLVKHFVKK